MKPAYSLLETAGGDEANVIARRDAISTTRRMFHWERKPILSTLVIIALGIACAAPTGMAFLFERLLKHRREAREKCATPIA